MWMILELMYPWKVIKEVTKAPLKIFYVTWKVSSIGSCHTEMAQEKGNAYVRAHTYKLLKYIVDSYPCAKDIYPDSP